VSQIRLKTDANPLAENNLRRSGPESPDPLIGKRVAAEIKPFWDTTQMADDRWPMINDRWPMINDRWPMINDRWPMADDQ
jgi:hypothetical protein